MLETKSISALAFNDTPRKRKRETAAVALPLPPLKCDEAAAAASTVAASPSCFTNAAFSSTPKKLSGRRRMPKETKNINPFGVQPGFEIKSIADLAAGQPQQAQIPVNPFEVVRNPSKKKKRERACFENPGLNLELPERQFNPYEVVRTVATPTKCFVNEALNLRGSDAPASLNPFEIHRRSDISEAAGNPAGVENQALADEPLPTSLKIGLPFAPTLGYRIDFNGISLSQLTPSKLLAEKLVFSPVQAVPAKRSLGAISEESSMDIGKELDRYQLELENSINEAKLRKNGVVLETTKTQTELKLLLEQKQSDAASNEQPERRIVCTMRRRTLTEITETAEEPEAEAQQAQKHEAERNESIVEQEIENDDVAYASESEDDDEDQANDMKFKAPSRFVRAYRPPAAAVAVAAKLGSKESLNSITSNKSSKSTDLKAASNASHGGVGHIIRKSIRKLMHPMQQQSQPQVEQSSPEKSSGHHNNIMTSIRHSLRRRPNKTTQSTSEEMLSMPADISIVDSSERTMKLRSIIPQTEYMTIEQLTNEKKHTLRNSIRRSTRDVLRHVFHKSHDAYATAK